MPKGNSIFDIYFAAESDPGKYEASKFGVQDIWSGFEHRDKMTKVKQENITNVVDSLQASIELGSTLYQGRSDRLQFESDLSTVSGGQDAIEVGSKGQKWEDMNLWDKMLSGGKQYQIGDKTYTKSDITVTAGVMKGDDLLEKTSLYDEQENPEPKVDETKQTNLEIDNKDAVIEGSQDFSYENIPSQYKLSESEWAVPPTGAEGMFAEEQAARINDQNLQPEYPKKQLKTVKQRKEVEPYLFGQDKKQNNISFLPDYLQYP